MHTYSVFGDVLRSELPFPELPAAGGAAARWTLGVCHDEPPLDAPRAIGEEPLTPGVTARLARDAFRYRLSLDDTGSFDVSRDGGALTWYPAQGASEELARLDVIGRVLAIAEHAAGAYCLHASAVVIAGSAVALIGPKGYGKSTTATALVLQGARLLTDDTLPIRISDVAVARPGVHGIRLRDDSARELGGAHVTRPALCDDKCVLLPGDDGQLALQPAPLAAIYLLNPRRPERATGPATRYRLGPLESALVLVAHGKIAALLRSDEAARALDRAARIALAAPVYTLAIARDFSVLDEVARTIIAWHTPSAQAIAHADIAPGGVAS